MLDFVSLRCIGPSSAHLKVQRGQAGTLKEWRQFVVNPIKKGQRREGMANDVVLSIVSEEREITTDHSCGLALCTKTSCHISCCGGPRSSLQMR